MSHRFKLEQIADVYKRFDQKEAGIEKVFLEVCTILVQVADIGKGAVALLRCVKSAE